MASRKDEKERLRQERLAAESRERSEARRREVIGYAAAGILGLIVVVGIVYAIATSGGGSKSSAGGANCSDPNAHVEFEYHPKLAEQDQLAIKGVFDQSPSGVLMFPNNQLTDDVAAAAWRNRMHCPKYEGSKTLDALADFRQKFRGVAGREFGFP